jgi:spore coat protein U-like protein
VPLILRLGTIGIIGAGLLVAWAAPALAACTAEVAPVAFGVVDALRQTRGTGEVVVRCDAAASFQVGLSPGRSSSGTRRMSGPGGARLDYYLFSDAGHSIPWGDGQALGSPVGGAASDGSPARLTVYGVIPAQSGVEAGEYDDSLQVTLTF